jgi:1-acyl-sn-glycerol-3-phosphate acyltransferase
LIGLVLGRKSSRPKRTRVYEESIQGVIFDTDPYVCFRRKSGKGEMRMREKSGEQNLVADWVWQVYLTRKLKKHFARVYVRCSEQINVSIPTLYMANHASWWDLYLAMWISRNYLRQDAYFLVNEQETDTYGWLGKEEVLSFDGDSYQQIQEALEHGAEILDGRFGSLWVFGQGEVKHPDFRPLRFLPGLGSLLEKVKHVQVVPVAFYYSMTGPSPEACIQLSAPIVPSTFEQGNRRAWIAACSKELTYHLDMVKEQVISENLGDFECVLAGIMAGDHPWPPVEDWKKQIEQWIQKIKKG